MLKVLRHRDFALLWAGQFVSVLGDHLLFLALPFYLLERTGSVLAAGGALAAGTIPRALFGPLGGVIADRYPHRRIMITVDLLNVTLVLTLLAVSRTTWLVYVVLFAHATAGQIFRPTRTALIPHLVERDQLLAANSLNSTSEAVTQLAGPALGGALFAIFGLTTVVVADAATFVVSALLLTAMRTRARSGDGSGAGFGRQLREGVQAVRTHPVAKALLTVAVLMGVASGALNVLVVPYVRDVLGRGPETLGLLASAQGLGGLVGAVATGTVGRRFSPATLITSAALGAGASVLIVANARHIAVAGGALLVAGAPITAGMIAAQTLLQTTTERRYLGRLAGIFAMAVGGSTVVGMVTAGVLADGLGTVAVMNVGAGVYVLGAAAAVIGLRTPRPPDARTVLFPGFSDPERRALSRDGDIVELRAGQVVQRETDPFNWVYFVLDGRLCVNESQVYGEGTVIGLSEAFDGRRSATTIIALTDATMLTVERRRLEDMFLACPHLALNVIRSLALRP